MAVRSPPPARSGAKRKVDTDRLEQVSRTVRLVGATMRPLRINQCAAKKHDSGANTLL